MIDSKKVVLSLNSMDTISTMKAQIAAMESINCCVDEILMNCNKNCESHNSDVFFESLFDFYDHRRIADCYTVVSGKYYYPWTWHEPWYKEGFMEPV